VVKTAAKIESVYVCWEVISDEPLGEQMAALSADFRRHLLQLFTFGANI